MIAIVSKFFKISFDREEAMKELVKRQALKVAELEQHNKFLLRTISAQEKGYVPWIPVSTKPESKLGDNHYTTTPYIVAIDGSTPYIAYWREGDVRRYWAEWSDTRITKYMPLPDNIPESHIEEAKL